MKQILFLLLLQPTLVSAQSKNIALLDHWQDTSLISNSSQVRYSGLFTFSKEAEQLPLTMALSGREKHFQNRVQQIEALGALQRILDLARAAMKCAHVQALWLVDRALHARDEVQSKDIRNCVSVQLAI